MSFLHTPQQNGVVERKNRVLQEMAWIMTNSMSVAKNLRADRLQLVISWIGYTFDLELLKPHMKFGMARNQMSSSSFVSLVANVTFLTIESPWGNSMPKVMMGFFLGTPLIVELLEYSTLEPLLSWSRPMLLLMTHAHLKHHQVTMKIFLSLMWII